MINQTNQVYIIHYLAEQMRCAHGVIAAKLNGREDFEVVSLVFLDELPVGLHHFV
jgi:hypothetical protein